MNCRQGQIGDENGNSIQKETVCGWSVWITNINRVHPIWLDELQINGKPAIFLQGGQTCGPAALLGKPQDLKDRWSVLNSVFPVHGTIPKPGWEAPGSKIKAAALPLPWSGLKTEDQADLSFSARLWLERVSQERSECFRIFIFGSFVFLPTKIRLCLHSGRIKKCTAHPYNSFNSLLRGKPIWQIGKWICLSPESERSL